MVLKASRYVRGVLGVRNPGDRTLLDDSVARARIREQMMHELVRIELLDFSKAMQAKDYKSAHQHALTAKTIMRRHPEISWESLESELAALDEQFERENPKNR